MFKRIIIIIFILFAFTYIVKLLNTNCDVTLYFCIQGVGSGNNIDIFLNGDCSGLPVATIITGDDGCAEYRFTSNCNSTHSVRAVCTGTPSQCSYFVPVHIGNNGTVNVFKCP